MEGGEDSPRCFTVVLDRFFTFGLRRPLALPSSELSSFVRVECAKGEGLPLLCSLFPRWPSLGVGGARESCQGEEKEERGEREGAEAREGEVGVGAEDRRDEVEGLASGSGERGRGVALVISDERKRESVLTAWLLEDLSFAERAKPSSRTFTASSS